MAALVDSVNWRDSDPELARSAVGLALVMVARMEARELSAPRLVARAGLVTVRPVELADVPFALGFACSQGLRARAVVVFVAVSGAALCRNECWDAQHADSHRNADQILHWDLPASLSLALPVQLFVGVNDSRT
jgi:hypothetical protein